MIEKIDIWVTNSLDKIFPETEKPPRWETSARFKAAGNEHEDFQVVIRPQDDITIDKAWVTFSGFEKENDSIDPAGMEAYWIWYTWVMHNPPHSKDPGSWLRNAPGFFPDAFLENKEYKINPGWTQPLWVKINIPGGTPAGTYEGKVLIHLEYSSGDAIWGSGKDQLGSHVYEIPVSIDVWSFSLCPENTLRHTEWFHPNHLADFYHLERWSEDHWKWIGLAAADMAAHYQDMIITDFFNLVPVIMQRDGSIHYNFERLDRWIATFRNAGVSWIEGGHLAGRIGGWESDFAFLRIPLVDENGNSLDDFSREVMSDEDYTPYLEAFLGAVYKHIESEWGLEFLVQHVADEPLKKNQDSWKKVAAQVKTWLPANVKTIDATFSEELGEYLDIRVPQIQEIDASKRENEADSEPNLWSYICLAPQGHHPNRFLDFESIRNRIVFWLCHSLNLEGFLHWGYNFYESWCSLPECVSLSPWTDSTGGSVYAHKRQPLPAGDPFIVYPGRKTLCSSIRWEVLRKGIEDHKLLTMLKLEAKKDNGVTPAGKKALNLLQNIRENIAHDSLVYTRDDSLLLQVREQAGDLLEELLC